MAESQKEEAVRPAQLGLDWLVANLRWLWLLLLAVFVVAGNLVAEDASPDFNNLLILIGSGMLLNGAFTALLWAGFFPTWMAVIATIIDMGIATAFLLLSGSLQFVLPLVLFPVIIAGVRWNTEAGLLTTLPLIIVYALPVVATLQPDSTLDRAQLVSELITLGAYALVLVLGGTLPGFFVRQRVEIIRRETEAEVSRLRIENEQGRLISNMAQTLSSTLNYRKVLRATVDTAFQALSEAGEKDESVVGMVLLFEGDDGRLTVASGRNISRKDSGRKVRADDGLLGRTVSTAEVTITNRALEDKSVNSFASTPGSRSAICAPLRAGFQTYGVILFCSTQPNAFSKEHKMLLSTLASQAIIAMQNAQLFDDLHREQQRLLEKESEARRKLARDLHDGPTQSVAAVVMRLNFIKMVLEKGDVNKALEEVIKVEDIAQRTTHEIRTMLFAMRPVILETQGLVPALNQYAERLNQTESFQVRVVNKGYSGQLDGEAEGVIFAIIEEAVGNAKKHAQATEIRISLVVRTEELVVEIRDNGVGFDVQKTQSTYDQRTSLGLINMSERAEIVGGECTLESKPGRGTAVKVMLPLKRSVS
jgi:signal transduction histidine kinase